MCKASYYTPKPGATECVPCPSKDRCTSGIDRGATSSSGISVGAIAGIVGAVCAAAVIGGTVAYKMNTGENSCDTNELLGEKFRSNLLADTEGQRKSRLEMDRRNRGEEQQGMLAGAIPAEEDPRTSTHSAM